MPESPSRYPVPAGPSRSEVVVERSRFIASVAPAPALQQAQEFIAAVRREFADASHNCWAFLCGPPGSSARVGCSDDGEPSGCAGRPMLSVLQHAALGDLVLVVSRYFGGVKLGKGGLVRAYTDAAQTALAELTTTEKIDWQELRLRIAYPRLATVERLLPAFEAQIVARSFAAEVELLLKAPAERLEPLRTQLVEKLAGDLELLSLPE